jgi:hypothetical protein
MLVVTSPCLGWSSHLKVILFLVYEASDFPYGNQKSSAFNFAHCVGLLFMAI